MVGKGQEIERYICYFGKIPRDVFPILVRVLYIFVPIYTFFYLLYLSPGVDFKLMDNPHLVSTIVTFLFFIYKRAWFIDQYLLHPNLCQGGTLELKQLLNKIYIGLPWPNCCSPLAAKKTTYIGWSSCPFLELAKSPQILQHGERAEKAALAGALRAVGSQMCSPPYKGWRGSRQALSWGAEHGATTRGGEAEGGWWIGERCWKRARGSKREDGCERKHWPNTKMVSVSTCPHSCSSSTLEYNFSLCKCFNNLGGVWLVQW